MIDVAQRSWAGGRVGRIEGGTHRGMFCRVEEDASQTGFHIWLTERHPAEGPSPGWDIWADTADDIDDWFVDELLAVRWL